MNKLTDPNSVFAAGLAVGLDFIGPWVGQDTTATQDVEGIVYWLSICFFFLCYNVTSSGYFFILKNEFVDSHS